MGVGTNDNIKDINERIENVENNTNTGGITNVINNGNNETNFNSNAQENVKVNSEKIIEPNFQKSNNDNIEQTMQFKIEETQRIDFLTEFIKEKNNQNNESQPNNKVIELNTKNEDFKEVTAQQDVFDEPKIRNSQKVVEGEVEQNNINNQAENEKKHTQDKKDYRLERMLFERINKMQGKIKESLELIKKFERINAKEENLPNIVTTLHDKLTHEVIKQFRTVGIEFNMKSYLVQAIVSDLLSKFEEGITDFKNCSENLNFVREVQEDFESRVEIAPTSKVKNIFARLRGLFKPERKQERLEQLERERQEKKLEEANIHLIKYKFKNSELEKYTIRKNIVSSLTREMLHGQGSGLTLNVTEFINTKVAPEMKKLGLEGLLPELEKSLYQEYKEKNENVEKQDFMNLSIGDVKKSMKYGKYDFIRTKVNVVNIPKSEEDRMVI